MLSFSAGYSRDEDAVGVLSGGVIFSSARVFLMTVTAIIERGKSLTAQALEALSHIEIGLRDAVHRDLLPRTVSLAFPIVIGDFTSGTDSFPSISGPPGTKVTTRRVHLVFIASATAAFMT
jgi:hypothetical protein